MKTRLGNYSRHLLALCTLCFVATNASAELVVIVSSRNPNPVLNAEQVSAIFLGQTGSFPDGAAAVAIDQGLGAAQRDLFYRQLTGKTPALLKAHWSKMVFTGRGQPPREAPSDAAVRRMVADNPSMIGYIERAALDPSVRPVLVLQ
ncbi:phosphate ABC transporter substrate-binding protein [Massilia aurea]|jgi:ABC-type phosphate transport system substrate-binding protein|uniref:phosphate ABC transporter substrate-binding protein n=1 Tax=Massilia aurea TaxID=373040 RepID=UPI0021633E82|nr:phosphate ABC transporter substrate-binding protein [Massilia aurea]MCS0709285.1 phosphate ABC transporter substrate-binding protein [Massilia aurea]